MKLLSIFILVLMLQLTSGGIVMAQTDTIAKRIFLVGNAGVLAQEDQSPVCDWLKRNVNWNDSINVLLMLGNNVYKSNTNDDNLEIAKKVIDHEASIVRGKNARLFIAPGFADWNRGKPGGWEQVKHETEYVESLQLSNVQMLPGKGCPGPLVVGINANTDLVFMDSQWWQQDEEKPSSALECESKTKEDIINGMKEMVSLGSNKNIILVSHHSLFARRMRGEYLNFKQELESVIKGHSNIIHVSGNEKALKFFE